jgi:hypothetical protein
VALVLDQVRVVLPPDCTVVGLADSVTVGVAGGETAVMVVDWLADPPLPEQVSV